MRGRFFPLLLALLLLPAGGCSAASSDTHINSPSLEASVRESASDGFLRVDLGEDAIHHGDLILVNAAHPAPAVDPLVLVTVGENKNGSYFVRSLDMLATPETIAALNEMLDGFLARGGSKTINLTALWRSHDTQQRLFERSVERNGIDHALRYVAQSGASEHHTGLAADLALYFPDGTSADFTGEGEYVWITEHAPDYGLIVRYSGEKESITGIAAEPWHFRFIGIPHARKLTELGLCLEEYIAYLRTFPFAGEHLFIDCGTARYEVWYEAGSAVHLPIEGEYSVSGDNEGGIIVTRKLLDGGTAGEYTEVNGILPS